MKPMTAPVIKTVGVPTEVKTAEHRVALTPDGVRELDARGIQVRIQAGAGVGASIMDEDYIAAGATIVPTAADAWAQEMVLKVKEPKAEEFQYLREDLTLFTYLHLAAYPGVAAALLAAKTTSVAYETVQLADGSLPLLAPMSEVAGRLAPQMGAHFLERHKGGRGVLMGGVPGVSPAKVVVLGAGNVGWSSAVIAAGMEAEVTVLDKNLERLRYVDQIHKGRISTLASNQGSIERTVMEADLVIGAVLVAGGRAPIVVSEDLVRQMKPRAVIVDVAVDQGGCIATTRETTCRALRRRQHAGRRTAHQYLCTDQRNTPLPAAGCTRRCRRRRTDEPGSGTRPEHRQRCLHQRDRGGVPRRHCRQPIRSLRPTPTSAVLIL
jgi:alanine dehydrogenase